MREHLRGRPAHKRAGHPIRSERHAEKIEHLRGGGGRGRLGRDARAAVMGVPHGIDRVALNLMTASWGR